MHKLIGSYFVILVAIVWCANYYRKHNKNACEVIRHRDRLFWAQLGAFCHVTFSPCLIFGSIVQGEIPSFGYAVSISSIFLIITGLFYCETILAEKRQAIKGETRRQKEAFFKKRRAMGADGATITNEWRKQEADVIAATKRALKKSKRSWNNPTALAAKIRSSAVLAFAILPDDLLPLLGLVLVIESTLMNLVTNLTFMTKKGGKWYQAIAKTMVTPQMIAIVLALSCLAVGYRPIINGKANPELWSAPYIEAIVKIKDGAVVIFLLSVGAGIFGAWLVAMETKEISRHDFIVAFKHATMKLIIKPAFVFVGCVVFGMSGDLFKVLMYLVAASCSPSAYIQVCTFGQERDKVLYSLDLFIQAATGLVTMMFWMWFTDLVLPLYDSFWLSLSIF